MISPPRYWAVYRIYIYPTNLNHGFVQCLICTPAARGAKVPIPHTMLCRTSLITATQRIFFYTARGGAGGVHVRASGARSPLLPLKLSTGFVALLTY